MLKIKIFSVGKTKEAWLNAALDEYTQRLVPSLRIEWILTKDMLQLKQFVAKESHYICLDPAGILPTSEEFSSLLMKWCTMGGSRLGCVIGDASGLPQELKSSAIASLSLSRMTFTHQMTRLIFIEQIYRAIEIQKGSMYHH